MPLFIEEVHPSNYGIGGQVHYLSHLAVVKKNRETTNVHIVYDALAISTGCSLNECLHNGPKFEQIILLRFRNYPISLDCRHRGSGTYCSHF